jgi:Protein of unknown function (DUF4199)
MNQISRNTIGWRYGLYTGILYAFVLFLRYKVFASTPVSFGLFTLVSYIVILLMFLLTGIARKKELGGYGEYRDIFTSIFIAILIAELFYLVFNLIYFKFIDPAFWENFKSNTLAYIRSLHYTDAQIEQEMKGFKDMGQQTSPGGLIKGYGFGVVIDSVFGLIFALILRRKKPDVEKISGDPN